MWLPESRLRVWLYRRPSDMRKSFDGLAALVKGELCEQPTSGDLYAFLNRRRTLMKVLYFERGGYCVWSKRLEQGQFQVAFAGAHKALLEPATLKLIIDGIDTTRLHRFKRYRLPETHRHLIEYPV